MSNKCYIFRTFITFSTKKSAIKTYIYLDKDIELANNSMQIESHNRIPKQNF